MFRLWNTICTVDWQDGNNFPLAIFEGRPVMKSNTKKRLTVSLLSIGAVATLLVSDASAQRNRGNDKTDQQKTEKKAPPLQQQQQQPQQKRVEAQRQPQRQVQPQPQPLPPQRQVWAQQQQQQQKQIQAQQQQRQIQIQQQDDERQRNNQIRQAQQRQISRAESPNTASECSKTAGRGQAIE